MPVTEVNWDTPPSEDSLADLLVKIEVRARSMVFRYGLHREDADDLLQEVSIIFLRKREQIYSPEAWLLATLRNQCLTMIRRRYADAALRVDRVVLEEIAACGDDSEAIHELNLDLHRAMGGMEERCRNVLRLRYLDGLRPLDLAQELGYKPSGIYKIIQRCVAALSLKLLNLGTPRKGPK